MFVLHCSMKVYTLNSQEQLPLEKICLHNDEQSSSFEELACLICLPPELKTNVANVRVDIYFEWISIFALLQKACGPR